MNIKTPVVYDISHWKEVADFTKVFPKPFLFITKATEGISYTDDKFVRFFDGMKQIGSVRGAFHFHRKAYNAVQQAEHFVSTIRPYVTENDLLILDVEEGGETASSLIAWFTYVMNEFPKNYLVIYSRKNILDPIPMTADQSAFFKNNVITWTAGYPTNPDLFSSVPAIFVPDPAKWGITWLWQYTDKAIIDGIEGSVDLSWIHPSFASLISDWTPPIEPGDEKLSTHLGVDQYHIRRFGTDCYVTVIDLTKVRTKIHLGFMTVFDAVTVYGAQLGFNMGGWGDLPNVSAPDEYLVIDGVVKQDQMTGSGWIDLSKDNKITIDTAHPNFPTRWNLWGFDRIIAKNRVYNTAITNPNSEPRTINGKDSQGKLVILVCEGRSTNQKGLTFPEVWSVMQEFDVVDCGNADGGYSSASVDTYFTPPLRNSTYLVENRRVVSQLLFYTNEPVGGDVKTYKVLVPVKPRPTPEISGGTSANVPAGTTFQSDTVVPGLPAGTSFVKYVTGEWLPLVYNGVEYVKDITPPPVYQLPPYVYLELPDGTKGKYNKEQL